MPALEPAAASDSAGATTSATPEDTPDGSSPPPESSTESPAQDDGERSPGGPGRASPPQPGRPSAPQDSERQATIAYRTVDRDEERFTTAVTVTNEGSRAISGWTLRLHYREIRVYGASGAEVSASGDTVTARGTGGTGTIPPGQAVSFEIEASGPNPMPSGCSFDGRRCQD